MAEDKGKLIIKFESSRTSPAGAAAAFLLRRIAARAGTYAPGIQEHIFYEVLQQSQGASLDRIERWIRTYSEKLAELAYHVMVRPAAARTEPLKEWVVEGKGYRAAILLTDATKLYQDPAMPTTHAVGLTVNDATSGIADDTLGNGLFMIDGWPGNRAFVAAPATLDVAQRIHKYRSLLLYWVGYG